MIFVIFPLFFLAIANLYYFLFFNKPMKKNIWWLLLVVVVGSLALSFSMSTSNYSSLSDLSGNFFQFFIFVAIYASILLVLHHFLVNGKIILIEHYSAYLIMFFVIAMFAFVFYAVVLAFIIGTGS